MYGAMGGARAMALPLPYSPHIKEDTGMKGIILFSNKIVFKGI